MITPGTRCALTMIPINRIVFTEHQARYRDQFLHYLDLYTDPQHTEDHAGIVHVAPLVDASGFFTVLDGHHRTGAAWFAGRSQVLALVEIAPDQQIPPALADLPFYTVEAAA